MRRVKGITIVMMMVMTFLLGMNYIADTKQHRHAVGGVLDMQYIDFEETPVIDLDGEWSFYWDKLLEPSDFVEPETESRVFINIPGNWSHDMTGNYYPNIGYATYKLKIINVPSKAYFALEKLNIRNACRIFVNGRQIMADGAPMKESEANVIGNMPQIAFFEVDASSVEIIIQVSNFEYASGGIANSIYFGTQRAVLERSYRQNLFEIVATTIMIVIGILYLIVHFIIRNYKRREAAIFFFALSCLLMALSNGFVSQRVFANFIPKASFEILFKMYYFLAYSFFVAMLFFVNKVNRIFLPDRIRNVVGSIFLIYILMVLFLPMKIYWKLSGVYLIIDLIVSLAILFWVFYLYTKPHTDVVHFTVHSILLMALYAMNIYVIDNVLYALGLKKDIHIGMISMVIYSVMLVALLVVIYSDAYKKNAELAIRLVENYYALDQKEEVAIKNEIAFLQAQIKPHFLFNAMSSIIGLCYTDGERAGDLLQELMNFLKSSFDFDYKSDYVTIKSELNLIQSFVKIEKERFGERIEINYNIDPNILNMKIIPLIIEPLVENAIRHGVLKNKSGGHMSLTIKKVNSEIYICVEDNGHGIPKEKIESILTVSNLESAPSVRNGVGLANINNRLQYFYNKTLEIESTDRGTRVSFKVPLLLERGRLADEED